MFVPRLIRSARHTAAEWECRKGTCAMEDPGPSGPAGLSLKRSSHSLLPPLQNMRGLFAVVVGFLVPRLTGVFTSTGAEIPMVTRMLMATSISMTRWRA